MFSCPSSDGERAPHRPSHPAQADEPTNQEEYAQVTAPSKTIAFPTIDHVALQKLVDAQRGKFEVQTRSQAMLQEAIRLEQELLDKGKQMRDEIRNAEESIAKMQGLTDEMRTAEQDNALQLSVVIHTIQMLKQAGVQVL